MSERVILAYSGGLDTSVAISWIGKETGREVVAVAIDLGQGGEDMEVVRQRALDCGAVEAVVVDARDEFADELLPAHHLVQRALHGPLPAGVGDQPAADRQASGRRGPRARRRHRRARLHRQGQRPGPLRGRIRLAGTGSGGARPGPRLRVDAGEGHRVRRGERHPDQRHQALAVLDRPERVGPRGGNRLPRAPVERAHQGRLRLHRRPDGELEHPRRGDRRLRARRAGDRSTASRYRCCRPSRNSTSAPARRASAASTSSRTGWWASRAAKSTRRRARWCSSPRTPNSNTSRWSASWAGSSGKPTSAGRELVYDGLWYSPLKTALETLRRQDAGARHRRDPNGVARRAHRRQRPAQQRVAVRLQPGHLRRGRHVRSVGGEGLRLRARAVVQDLAAGPRRPPHRERRGERSDATLAQ